MSAGIKPSPFHIALWEFWAQKAINLFTLATIFAIINYSLFLTPRSFAFFQHSWNYGNHETLVNSQKLHSSWYILTLNTTGKLWNSSSKNTYFNMQFLVSSKWNLHPLFWLRITLFLFTTMKGWRGRSNTWKLLTGYVFSAMCLHIDVAYAKNQI